MSSVIVSEPSPDTVRWLFCRILVCLQLLNHHLKSRQRSCRSSTRPFECSRPSPESVPLLQEAAGLHYKLIAEALDKLRNGDLFNLEDQDGEIIARSSRILEAFQTEAIDRTFPSSEPASLLEIGCGSGFYIKHAAENPSLTALGLEMQPNVADAARRNIAKWGLTERVRIETGDIRERVPDERYDIVTLYNNIYYFPVEDRVSLLRHVKGFMNSGGFLLLTTCCQRGSLGVEVLNLWGAATATCGRLPKRDEIVSSCRTPATRM